MMYQVISDDPTVQSQYEDMREQGTSHRLAEMLALRQGPALSTDTRFSAGMSADPYDGVPGPLKKAYAAKARAAGVNPEGKHYNGFLARFPGDPRALIADRGDLRRVAEERGIGLVSGPVKVKAAETQPEETTPYQVADDIVKREVEKVIAQSGERPTPSEHAELTQQVRSRLSGDQDASEPPPIRYKE